MTRSRAVHTRSATVALIALTALVALAAACGGGEPPTATTATPDATVAPAGTEAAAIRPTPPASLPARAAPSALIPGSSGRAQPPAVALEAARRCVSDPSPRLTHHYIDLELIDMINPTIVTSGNWLKNRQYHKVVTDANNDAPEVPLYAPADAVAISVTHYLGTMQPWDGEPFELSQFEVRFQLSCEVEFRFDHISSLAEPFASLAPAEGVRDTRDAEVPIRVEVKAGDLIGYSSGTVPAHTWDFILVNTAKTNRFANQERYERSRDLAHLLHADCPFDYFDASMRAEYVERFGWWQGSVDGFDCDLEVDVVGTVAGGWFMTPFDPSDKFAVADWGVVVKLAADGYVDVNGPGASVRTAPDAPTFADPKLVTTEQCFEDYNRPASYAYLELLSDTQLAAAFGDGPCPAALPAEHAIYYR